MPSLSVRAKAARRHAEEYLCDEGLLRLPVDPFAIAKRLEIDVRPLPVDAMNGCSGMLLRNGNNFGIMYATRIRVRGYQRFSVAHELGHYLLPGHIDHVFQGAENQHVSYVSAKIGRDPFEIEANNFAAGLLMPERPLCEAMLGLPAGIASVEALSSRCITSLTATAFNYVLFAREPVIVVLSSRGIIERADVSPGIRRSRGLGHPRVGCKVPSGSKSAAFHESTLKIASAGKEKGETDLSAWGCCATPFPAIEEVRGLGNYDKVLTVLTCPDEAVV